MTYRAKFVTSAVKIADALSVESRLRILYLLRNHPLCVGALTHRLGITQGAVSQHLRVLKEADLVTLERRGQFMHYSLNRKTLRKFREMITELLETKNVKTCRKGEKSCPAPKKNVKRATKKE